MLLDGLRWRSIGPAIMGGRITDIEGIPGNPRVFYVAAATGGLWKTINGGITFYPIFDRYPVISLGDLALAPSNPDILYLGTGEEDARNSVSPGGGVYKSTDGGRSWTFVGLEGTQTVGRIVVDPRNPDVVYVAAVGPTWNPSPDRGLYKSTDGGRTWTKILYVNDRTGAVDVALDPRNPDVVWAAMWERIRGPYFLRSGGPGSGLYKSTDGGRTWTRIEGGGFPTTLKGRIGIALAPSNPDIVYAMVEADSVRGSGQGLLSGLYRSLDGGRTWERRNRINVRPFYYSQVRVDPKDPNRVYWLATQFYVSDDGGRTYRLGAQGIHVDHHAMWIDPQDPNRFLIGNDGGVAITYDRGGTFDFLNLMPLGQFYAVSFDFRKPYWVCGGLQDNGSWCGPSRARDGLTNERWINVGGGDGFYTASDPIDPDIVYSESQNGNISRLNLRTGERVRIRPPTWAERRRAFEDSLIIARGDTTQPETPEIRARLAQLRARIAADSAAWDLRFNWQTPFLISPHNPSTLYLGANRVLKSTDRGDTWVPISPDLTTRDPLKIRISTRETGGITRDVTGAETHATITTLAESPVRPGILWVGTDDGKVWVTRNDGGSWTDVSDRFPGLPRGTWVSRVEPSHVDSATVYVSFDGHRTGDYRPYVYVSTDFGRTFRSIVGNLPTTGPAFVHVIREDPTNPNVLYVGTDVGAYVSLDRGRTWRRLGQGLPTVPVHDIKIHPRDREIVAGTHGRSIYILEATPLQEWGDSVATRPAFLFTPAPAYLYPPFFAGGSQGHERFVGDSPPLGARLWYWIGAGAARDSVRVVITDVRGDTVRVLRGPARSGLNVITWDLRARPEPLGPAARRDSLRMAQRRAQVLDSLRRALSMEDTAAWRAARERFERELAEARAQLGAPPSYNPRPGETMPNPMQLVGGGGFGMGGRQGPLVEPGLYLATLEYGGVRHRRVVRVEHVDRDSRPVVERETESGPPEDEEAEERFPLAPATPTDPDVPLTP